MDFAMIGDEVGKEERLDLPTLTEVWPGVVERAKDSRSFPARALHQALLGSVVVGVQGTHIRVELVTRAAEKLLEEVPPLRDEACQFLADALNEYEGPYGPDEAHDPWTQGDLQVEFFALAPGRDD